VADAQDACSADRADPRWGADEIAGRPAAAVCTTPATLRAIRHRPSVPSADLLTTVSSSTYRLFFYEQDLDSYLVLKKWYTSTSHVASWPMSPAPR
jgi:hypothetical protein